ncbi:MAG: 30S ribosomal protein S15 [Candidatus Aenigmarchaeota archaeon]|nr:30S ribosomal protein S15 [Candidatus Aenigmarchaeota archaeon]MDW8149323.1 30S ribosomal protein S15 [Candidatus Aenigmarchaeota archaeon]
MQTLKIKEKKIGFSKEEIENLVLDLANKGFLPSRIGEYIWKNYSINVKKFTGKSIVQILREKNFKYELPEDLLSLMKKAIEIREHLRFHKKDKSSLRGLQLIESKIRSLAKYYKRVKYLPENWDYDPEKAKIIVSKVYGKS